MTSPADALKTERPNGPDGIDLDTVTIAGLRQAMESGALTAAELTGCYLERISRLDPVLRAVIAVHPDAMAAAQATDAARRSGQPRRPTRRHPRPCQGQHRCDRPAHHGGIARAGPVCAV